MNRQFFKSLISNSATFQPPQNHVENVEGFFYTSKNPELYFRDGKRIIDFVLAYKKSDNNPLNVKKRNCFLAVLASKKIEIEVEDSAGNVIASSGTVKNIESIHREYVCFADKKSSHHHDHGDEQETNTDEKAPLNAQSTSIGFDSLESAVEARNHARECVDDELVFVKLHASWELMLAYADVLKIRKPLKKMAEYTRSGKQSSSDGLCSCFHLKATDVRPISFPFTIPFSKSKVYLFDINENDRESFFTQTERSYVVHYILRRAGTKGETDVEKSKPPPTHSMEDAEKKAVMDPNLLADQSIEHEMETNVRIEDQFIVEEEDVDYGIAKLVKDGIFFAAYPLHEARKKMRLDQTSGEMNVRLMLEKHWANWKKIFKEQPIDYVRLYFGETIGFYFAWLEFYTIWLIAPTIVGLIIFLLGFIGLVGDPIVNDVCGELKDRVMCPLCLNCQTFVLGKGCMRIKFSRLLDNGGTVFFAIFMALWATLFMDYWKREQFRLSYRWNVHEMVEVEEPPRPEFIALVGKRFPAKKDTLGSGNPEPYIPKWRKRMITMFSVFIILASVALSIGILVCVIFFKTYFSYFLRSSTNEFLRQQASIFATAIGAIMSLISITVLTTVFRSVATYLTDQEHHRTQTQYDDALTVKLYMLQFVNFYDSIVYIAFVQGPAAAVPGDERNSQVSQYGCDGGNCLFEVFLQMVIIMVGKQLWGFVLENGKPVILNMINRIRLLGPGSDHGHSHGAPDHDDEDSEKVSPEHALMDGEMKRAALTISMCKNDVLLQDAGSCPLFDEYLEMMLQFGFITIFVAAFPLAPLFAFLNNIFEIRGDAKKFLKLYRRSVATRAKDIGIWENILSILARIAVRSNALMIAFTSQFIQRLVYEYNYRSEGIVGDDNYVNFTLSRMSCGKDRFNWELNPPCPDNICYYPDFREPPESPNKYEYTMVYWHILAAKFIFVFVFENVVIILTSLLAYLVPDVPPRLAILMRRETMMTGEIIVRAETSKGGEKLKELFDSKRKQEQKAKEEEEQAELQFYDFSSGKPRVSLVKKTEGSNLEQE